MDSLWMMVRTPSAKEAIQPTTFLCVDGMQVRCASARALKSFEGHMESCLCHACLRRFRHGSLFCRGHVQFLSAARLPAGVELAIATKTIHSLLFCFEISPLGARRVEGSAPKQAGPPADPYRLAVTCTASRG